MRIDFEEAFHGFFATHGAGNGEVHDNGGEGMAGDASGLEFFDGLGAVFGGLHFAYGIYLYFTEKGGNAT